MRLRIVYTDDFPADVAAQARWYARQRDEALALDYTHAVEATLEFLAQHPEIGTPCNFPEPQLAGLRFYLVEKPFDRNSSITAFPPKNLSPSAWCRECATSRAACSIRRGAE